MPCDSYGFDKVLKVINSTSFEYPFEEVERPKCSGYRECDSYCRGKYELMYDTIKDILTNKCRTNKCKKIDS